MTTTILATDLAQAGERYLADKWGSHHLRKALPVDPVPPGLWDGMAEMGWLDILVPADRGGLGLDATHAGTVLEMAGRHLVPGPLFDTMTTGPVLHRATDTSPATRVSLALRDARGGHTRVLERGVTGGKTLVPYADSAQIIVVAAHDVHHAMAFVAVQPGPGVHTEPAPTIDLVQRPCSVDLADAPVVAMLETGAAADALHQQIETLGWALHAARILGASERLLELAREHALTRHQFGRPLASFQAVQHRLADMKVRTIATRSATDVALEAIAGGHDDAPRRARVAKAYASAAGRKIAEDALQVLGGIGFTVDHDCHLYLKHLLSLQASWGDESAHAEVLAHEALAGSRRSLS